MALYLGNVPRRYADLKWKERDNVTGYFHPLLSRYTASLVFRHEILALRVEGGMDNEYFIGKSVTLLRAWSAVHGGATMPLADGTLQGANMLTNPTFR